MDDKKKPKNEPNLEKAAVLLMAALQWAESPEGQAAILKTKSERSEKKKGK
mgnify:CR=1 FL=1